MPRPQPFNNTLLNDPELNARTVDVIGDLDQLNQIYFPNSNLVSAINEVPNIMSKTFYVDSVNGDDGNKGSQAAPFATPEKAMNSIPDGGFGIIYLKAGETFEINSLPVVRNKTLRFRKYGTANKPVFTNVCDASSSNTAKGILTINSIFLFEDIKVKTADFADPSLPLGIWEGMFRRFDFMGLKALFHNCEIELGDTDLTRTPSGAHSTPEFYFFQCTITQIGNNRSGLILYNEAGNYIIADRNSSVTLRDGSTGTLNDLIGGQTTTTNHLQNF